MREGGGGERGGARGVEGQRRGWLAAPCNSAVLTDGAAVLDGANARGSASGWAVGQQAQQALTGASMLLHTLQAHMTALRHSVRSLHSAARMLPSPLPRPAAACPSLCSSPLAPRFLGIGSSIRARQTACRGSSSDSTAATVAAAATYPTPAMAAAMEAHRAALAAAAAAGPPLEGRTYAPEISWDPEVQAYLEAALGAEQLRRISAALARPPLATCLRVNTLRTTPQVGGRGWCLRHSLPLSQRSTMHVLQASAQASAAGRACLQPCTAAPALKEANCLSPLNNSTSPCCSQELLERLPAALTPEDRALVQQRPPYVHPQVRCGGLPCSVAWRALPALLGAPACGLTGSQQRGDRSLACSPGTLTRRCKLLCNPCSCLMPSLCLAVAHTRSTTAGRVGGWVQWGGSVSSCLVLQVEAPPAAHCRRRSAGPRHQPPSALCRRPPQPAPCPASSCRGAGGDHWAESWGGSDARRPRVCPRHTGRVSRCAAASGLLGRKPCLKCCAAQAAGTLGMCGLLADQPATHTKHLLCMLWHAGIMQGDAVAVSVGLELPGSDRYPFTRGTVLGSGAPCCAC